MSSTIWRRCNAGAGHEEEWDNSALEIQALELDGNEIPLSFTIALAASATTDGMDITVTAKDRNGNTLARAFAFHMFMSESAAGLGLTADTYSGDLTSTTGTTLGTLTSKKAWLLQTHTTGIWVGTLVDSANPTDQYVVVSHPVNGAMTISAASGTSWEGV